MSRGRRGHLCTDRAALRDEASLYGGRQRSHFAVQARRRGREEEVLSRKSISTAKTSTGMDGEIGSSEMPTDAYRCLQMSHRDLRKPNCSGPGCLAFGRYEDVYISPSSVVEPLGNTRGSRDGCSFHRQEIALPQAFRFTMGPLQACLCLLVSLAVLLFPLPCQPCSQHRLSLHTR